MSLRYIYNPIKSCYRPNRKHSPAIKAAWKTLKSVWINDVYLPLRFWMKRMDESFLYWIGRGKPAPKGTIDIRTRMQLVLFLWHVARPYPKEVYFFVNHRIYGENVMVFFDDDLIELVSFAKENLILRALA